MTSKMLELLLREYGYKKPTFISNNELFAFFEKYKDRIPINDFHEIRRHFIDELGLGRYIFREIAPRFDGVIEVKEQKSWPVRRLPSRSNVPHLGEFSDLLKLKRYSQKTIKSYMSSIRQVNEWLSSNKGMAIDVAGDREMYDFFMYMTNERKVSSSTVRVYRFSIQYFFNNILGRSVDLSFIEGLRNSKSLPTVLSRDEILKILAGIINLKHRTMLALMYSSGLRLSELINLRIRDIDSGNLTIFVKEGKGRKDRVTIFSESLVGDLAVLMVNKAPDDYLFTSSITGPRGRLKRLSGRTVQKVLEGAIKRAGVKKKITPHDLRHCFATHLLESGVSIRHIQVLLGHKNISTTTIYAKVSNPQLKGIRSPL
jgi:integrase/recombinase XerD